jgi:hypothetical protein
MSKGEKIMAYHNKLLLRENLADNGSLVSHGSHYTSPDIISHSLVNDPKAFFRGNYGVDPNERIDQSSRTNPVYARVKNMQGGASTGYLRLYRANISLFLKPSQWRDNPLKTPKGASYVKVMAGASGEIAIGDDVFFLDGTQGNYCIVGIVNDSAAETLPSDFKSLSEFILWVHENPAVAARNFSLMASGNRNDYESLFVICNIRPSATLYTVSVQASKLPDGTIFGLENTALHIHKTGIFHANDEMTHIIADSSPWPAYYDGYVRVFAKLPTGAAWPKEAEFEVSYYYAAALSDSISKFGREPVEAIGRRAVADGLHGGAQRLVLLGRCTAKFV